MKKLLFVALISLMSCTPIEDLYNAQVKRVAAADHDCPEEKVVLKSAREIKCGSQCYGDWMYDLDVCGRNRRYRGNVVQRSITFVEIKPE